MSATGLLTGVLTLAAIEVGLSSPWATRALGTTADTITAGVGRLISPDVGLIPNLHDTANGGTASTSGPSTSTGAASTAPTKTTAKQRQQAQKLVRLNSQSARAKPPPKGRKPLLAPTVTGSSDPTGLEQLLLGLAPSAPRHNRKANQ